jgi:hypothetical protein
MSEAATHELIPDSELEDYLQTVTDAVEHARQGHGELGFFRLLTALDRVELLQDRGVTWAGALAQLYREAVQNYRDYHEWRQRELAMERERVALDRSKRRRRKQAPPPTPPESPRTELVRQEDATALMIVHRRSGAALQRLDVDTLRGADLRALLLRNADLKMAELANADLRAADLRGADLRAADLRCADLRGANLRGARLRDANLRYVRYDDTTRWPWFFNPERHGDA